MDTPSRVLSNVITHGKYARWWGELGRRETFEEVIARNLDMAINQTLDLALAEPLRKEALERIRWAYRFAHQKKVLPSMRSAQFAGEPIFRDPNRIYNCGYRHADSLSFFRELMFLLLGGSGIGYSVQYRHVMNLPPFEVGAGERRFLVQDSVVGWADSVDALIGHYFRGEPYPLFDYRDVRPAGTVLKTSGGMAPGPEPLERALERIDKVLDHAFAEDAYLEPIDVHDIACHLADAVLSGGIRRSAMIALFSPSDTEMLEAKSGRWWEDNPQRGRANNSAVLVRGRDEDHFDFVFDTLQESGSGEPGIYWTDDPEMGTNPCAEIALHDKQFCNLTTINVGDVEDQQDLNERARAAAIIGTVQATFTDFHYLSSGWQKQTEAESLVGVSMTGIASGHVAELDLEGAATEARLTNSLMANILGITPAARVTTVKPEGTASLVLGTSSGIHAWYDEFYVRRIIFNKSEALAQYLMSRLPYRQEHVPGEVWPIEDHAENPANIVLAVPQKAPPGGITRAEGAIDMLERVADVTRRWVRPGHRSGANFNNVSTTVNVREDEWDQVRDWMYENRELYTGLAVMPYDGGTYTQAPFETITEEQYELLAGMFDDIDPTEVDETSDYTNLAGEAACAGGACEVTYA